MDTVTTELTALAIIIIGALGTLVKVLVSQIAKKLEENTILTIQAKDAANGQLSSVIAQLAAERNLVTGLRAVVRERDDRLAYLVSRLPEAQKMLRDYSDRRASRATDADVIAAENHLLSE